MTLDQPHEPLSENSMDSLEIHEELLVSPITQVDGLYEVDQSIIHDIRSDVELPEKENVNVRSSKYSLNHKRQTKRIEADALLPDFDVRLNNNNENDNIKCSPGFYAQVVKPCFNAIDEHSILSLNNITVNVSNVSTLKDKIDALLLH